MAVDNVLQYNGRNSYRVTDIVWSFPFGVQSSDHVTHSFQAYCDQVQSAGIRAKTKFIDEHGDRISEVTHSFAIGTTFELQTITVDVPVGAIMAQVAFLQGGRDWWVAEPKSEPGETATPYNVNYQGQLTLITPTGLYTGMITTNQVVVTGSPALPGEKLDERLIIINNKMVSLEAAIPSVGGIETRVTAIEAGQITLSSRIDGVEPRVTKITSEGVYTGTIQASQITAGQISAARIDITDIFSKNITASGTISGVKLSSPTITGGSLNIGSGAFTVSSAGKVVANSAEITGTLKAGSVINGSLNSTTGTHTGSTTGSHTGSVNSSSIAGSLAGTGGYHSGSIYSGSGSLAGVSFSPSGSTLLFGGLIYASGLGTGGQINTGYTGTYGVDAAGSRMRAIAFVQSSDESRKENIRSADEGFVQDIYNVPIREFSFKGSDKKEIGVNANEIIRTMPRRFTDIIVDAYKGEFNANYVGMGTMAILAIQDLNRRVKKLEG